MKVLVTGASGFIAKNVIAHLKMFKSFIVFETDRRTTTDQLKKFVTDADFILHLAGVNRPENENEFISGNLDLTQTICELIIASGKKTPILFSSTIQIDSDNGYGRSKRLAEASLKDAAESVGLPIYICRFPNVFGKWARPNYNSVVATFCNNILNDLPIRIDNPNTRLNLIYVDDLVKQVLGILRRDSHQGIEIIADYDCYNVSLGEIVSKLRSFKESRTNLTVEHVGEGFDRALYSTYISYFSKGEFVYTLPDYSDERGSFVEVLKTSSSGQFSFFTAGPGVTRGGHYHHTKSEKFIVLKGQALFKFKNIVTHEYHEHVSVSGSNEVVETIPGWTHDITNIGDDELLVIVWANEIFDRHHPDTYSHPLT